MSSKSRLYIFSFTLLSLDPQSASTDAAVNITTDEEPLAEDASEPGRKKVDPVPGRLIFTQTAFTTRKGSFIFSAVDVADIYFSFGLSDFADITINTIPPVMCWGLGIYPRFAFKLHPNVRLGAIANAGFLWFFPFNGVGVIYGGAPLLMTFGNEDHHFKVSVHLEGVTLRLMDYHEDDPPLKSYEHYFFILPNVGGSFRVAKKVKVHFEIWTLLSPSELWMEQGYNGFFWGIMYGLRIFNANFYADINFVYPIVKGMTEILVYSPVGYPMVSFGFNF